MLGGRSLRGLVRGLNQIGVKPQGIIAILQAIKIGRRAAGGHRDPMSAMIARGRDHVSLASAKALGETGV